jgi:hypothetical protein
MFRLAAYRTGYNGYRGLHGQFGGELLAKAIKFRDPRLMFATWFPQRHLVICVAEAKLRTTLVKTENRLCPELFRPAIATWGLRNLHATGEGDVEYACVRLSR